MSGAGWVKVDHGFTNHRKVYDIGPLGECLWLRGLCYAGSQQSDGFIPMGFIKRMGDMDASEVAESLVNAGLWDREEGGFSIHDYLDWQRSRDEIALVREKRVEAGRAGGKQRAKQSASKVLSKPVANTLAEEEEKRKEEKRLLSAFDRFWKDYPIKKGKQDALKSWMRISPDDTLASHIIGRVNLFVVMDRQWMDGYAPHASTFLNGNRWNDEIEQVKEGARPPKPEGNWVWHERTARWVPFQM